MFKVMFTGGLLAVATAFPLSAQVIQELHDALPEEYREEGITVAVFNDWAPDEFVDENGELQGWSVDIAREMEERLGVPFEYVPTSFDAIIPGLHGGRFDAGFSSFGTTAERLESLDFVAQRLIGSSFAYPLDSELDIKTPEDACGLTVSVLNGSWDVGLLEELNTTACADNPIELQTYQDQAQANLAIRTGRADATVASSVGLKYQQSQTEDIQVSELILQPVNSSIGVRRGDPLGQVMADAIQTMIDDGTYQEIMAKWGIDDAGMLTEARLITKENPADL